MGFYLKAVPKNVTKILFICLILIKCILARRFGEQSYYPGYYNPEEQYAKIQTALGQLDHAPQWDPNWPDPSVRLGQVSGVALNNIGQVLVFHRGSHTWDINTFNNKNVYMSIGEPPIEDPTVFVFDETGELVEKWGENLFHMPHGITVDKQGNVWVTDVALHQVFKFTPENKKKPALVLGEKFVPKNDETHFCKPSAVAVLPNGDFFVADGYCNTRIIKFAPDGTRILQWGRSNGDSPYVFNVPHALTLAEDRGLLCVADRERGRVACFRTDNGTYVAGYSSWLIGSRLFSVAYTPVKGGRLYLVNGPEADVPVRGYVIDFDSGHLIQTFATNNHFQNPHDIVTSPDGSTIYVAELNPYKVYKFVDESLRNETLTENKMNVSAFPVKPTTVVERDSLASAAAGGWSGWRGWAGGAAGVLLLLLLVMVVRLVLRAARSGEGARPLLEEE